MQHWIAGPLSDHTRNLMRRAGYGEQRTRSGQISFIRRVTGERFPRYHAYAEDKNQGMQINLHVDQKEASYEGAHAHSGEYEGPIVQREMARLVQFVESLKSSVTPPSALIPKKKNFLSRFF
ncbi:hypothetical protein HZA85_03125 [Candidatus Uhrbacteria bacterium]|nr:hypothetical protein [Candidatus Uhrbacteria bacterium]